MLKEDMVSFIAWSDLEKEVEKTLGENQRLKTGFWRFLLAAHHLNTRALVSFEPKGIIDCLDQERPLYINLCKEYNIPVDYAKDILERCVRILKDNDINDIFIYIWN